MDFIQHIRNQSEYAVTENGAIGYRSAGTELDTMNFLASSMRSLSKEHILARFSRCLEEDFRAAVLWLFFARDARRGMGERRLFRTCMHQLSFDRPEIVERLIPLIPEYGRWDDLLDLFNTPVEDAVIDLLCYQLAKDTESMKTGKPISLCAKWMPSENCSSYDTRRKASHLRSRMGLTPKWYRKMLSALRAKLKVVERDMSGNRWGDIDYSAVPSRANLLYGDAFLRHDTARRETFIGEALAGREKMNASVLFPYEISRKYGLLRYDRTFGGEDPEIEALWRNLPDTVPPDESTLVVADGSGSMLCGISKSSNVTALDVCESLAIYFSERLRGPYKDCYITFSGRPQFVDLSRAKSLLDKVRIARRHCEAASTNIKAVFELILETAVVNGLSQAELPRNVLIISDMEFDAATYGHQDSREMGALLDRIATTYSMYDYDLPRLVFWNLASRSHTVPMQKNKNGVTLVSGFSPNVAQMVMAGKTDPHEVLMETLMSSRYEPVRKALG